MNGKKETLGISVLGCYIHTVNVIKPYTSFQSVKPPLPWEPPIQGYDFPRVLDGDNIDKLETRIKKKHSLAICGQNRLDTRENRGRNLGFDVFHSLTNLSNVATYC